MCDGMGHESDYVVVSTTVSDEVKADKLARKIVEARLAACVQRTVVKSTYRWKGKVEQADEVLLAAKTRTELSRSLMHFIQDNHSYEVPEVIITPIIAGAGAYLQWIDSETKQ